MPFDDPLVYGVIVLGVVLTCLTVIYAMRRREKQEKFLEEEEKSEIKMKGLPFRIERSISREDATQAREELRIMDLEREILGGAIRRLYEAHAEGKITEKERERIAQTYKSRMMMVKEAISKDESLVALHELEIMQEDLIKLFSERFDELSTKVDELRSTVDVEPIREITIPVARKPATTLPQKPAKGRKKKTTKKPSPRTEAEKRIEKIRLEVEKVLEKLGQMEIET